MRLNLPNKSQIWSVEARTGFPDSLSTSTTTILPTPSDDTNVNIICTTYCLMEDVGDESIIKDFAILKRNVMYSVYFQNFNFLKKYAIKTAESLIRINSNNEEIVKNVTLHDNPVPDTPDSHSGG